jgi:hypothetical protein
VDIHSKCKIKVFWALLRKIQTGERESLEEERGRGMNLGFIRKNLR